jgi:hypothetical protein
MITSLQSHCNIASFHNFLNRSYRTCNVLHLEIARRAILSQRDLRYLIGWNAKPMFNNDQKN